jgi:hypothetical protein
MCSLRLSVSPTMPGQGAIRRVDKSIPEQPITGLPESRKRPHAFGTPTINEFLAAIARHRGSSTNRKARGSREKK